jgi:hypothetical protein
MKLESIDLTVKNQQRQMNLEKCEKALDGIKKEIEKCNQIIASNSDLTGQMNSNEEGILSQEKETILFATWQEHNIQSNKILSFLSAKTINERKNDIAEIGRRIMIWSDTSLGNMSDSEQNDEDDDEGDEGDEDEDEENDYDEDENNLKDQLQVSHEEIQLLKEKNRILTEQIENVNRPIPKKPRREPRVLRAVTDQELKEGEECMRVMELNKANHQMRKKMKHKKAMAQMRANKKAMEHTKLQRDQEKKNSDELMHRTPTRRRDSRTRSN